MTAWLLRRWAPIAALIAGLILYLKGRSDASVKASSKATRAALDAERARQEIDNDIATDMDLARRARDAGLLRPKR
jgi:hypothetical protein